jgi:hypothetical protein
VLLLGGPEEDRHCWNTQQECVVCGTVYVTGTEKRVQEQDSLALGTLSESRQNEITASSMFVDGLSAKAKGKEKTSESSAVPAVRFIKE